MMWISIRGGEEGDEVPDGGERPVDQGMDEKCVLDLDQAVGALPEEPDALRSLIRTDVELGPQAVVLGSGRGDDGKGPFRFHAAGALEGVEEDLLLQPQLRGIGDERPGCAGALFLASTGRGNAVGGRFDDLFGDCVEDSLPLPDDPGADELAGQYARDEHGLARGEPAEAFPAVDQFFDAYLVGFAHPRIFLTVSRRAAVSAALTM